MKKKLLTFVAISLGVSLAFRKERAALDVDAEPVSPTVPNAPERPLEVTRSQKEAPELPPSRMFRYVSRTFNAFMDDECMNFAAATAYYSVFSLAPLLLLVIAVTGLIVGRETVQGQIQGQLAGILGTDAASQIGTMIEKVGAQQGKNVAGAVVGFIVLLFGATGTFVALQDGLNRVWHVKPDPDAGVKAFLMKRLLSFGLILVVAFLLLVSFVISAALAAVGKWVSNFGPAGLSETVMQTIGILASWIVIAALFAAIFQVLPDARIEWRHVGLGAAITSALFTIGKTFIGLYVGKSGMSSAYGAAGSLVVIVFWLYYASLILLMGAEFTKIWAAAHGHTIEPEPEAIKVTTQELRHA